MGQRLQTRSVWTVSVWLAPMVLGPRLPQFCVTPPTLPSPTLARTVLLGFPCQLASIIAGSLKCVDPTLALKACPWHQFLSVVSSHLCWVSTLLHLAQQSLHLQLLGSIWIILSCLVRKPLLE